MAAAGQQVPPPLPDTPRPASQAANPALEAAEHAFALLLDAGLSDTTASTVLEEAIRLVPPTALTHPERLIETGLARLVALLPGGPSLTAETLAGKTVFFTGPAGSGKTTALLKTALHLRRAGADIGIAGADVSRIGAAEQLLRYGEVLRLPVAIAYEPDDLARTLAEAPPGRITLVDTAAAGPGPDGLDELQAYLAAADDPIVVLTVSAGTGEGDLRRLSAMARAIGVATTAITRLDTAAPAASGVALNILAHLRLPLLLCSAGRDVLAGLSRVTAAALAAQTVEALLSADDDTETARAAA
jgi:flagellar biosynthesis protein FlhF